MGSKEDMKKQNSPCFFCPMKCFSASSSSSSFSSSSLTFGSSTVQKTKEKLDVNVESDTTSQTKPGGWRSMPYILGNETFERLAAFGLLANFSVYLLRQFHLSQVFTTNVLNIWSGTSNFGPLIGAIISDSYLGRYRTIAVASVASFLGLVILTLTASVPELRPPPCSSLEQCSGPSKAQLGVLFMGLGFLSIGAAGIRPCSLPFGVDQFDHNTEKGRKDINSFFNWYYFTFTVAVMIALTIIVYIQDSISWAWGLGIPTALMFCAILLFFIGTRLYIHVPPQGSVLSGIAQVFVAAFKKRHLKLPVTAEDKNAALYDPPLKASFVSKLPLTNQFSTLNKASIIVDGEVKSDGSPLNQWKLCSIQQVEEVKCLIRILPIWASGIICFTAMTQQATFTVYQAMQMDRHLGPKFKIPPGSLGTISMLTLGIWVPIYDRIIVPALRRTTKHEGGITLLQRMGIGIVFSILSMVAAGLIEKKRRGSAISDGGRDGVAPISVMWLAPQLILMGFAEAFNVIGQIEFYNKQFPEHMQSIGNSLFFCTVGGANYVSSFVVTIVHKTTGKQGHPDWLTKNINAGRVDYYYYIFAAMGVLNLIYFLICAQRYRYKSSVQPELKEPHVDIELNPTKH